MKTLDPVEPGFDYLRNDFIGAIQSRVRQHGQPAGIVDQFNAIVSRNFEFRNPGWRIFFEEALESFINCAAQAGFDKGPGHMGPPWGMAFGQRKNGLCLQRDIHLVKASDDFAYAILSHCLEPGDFRQESWIAYVDIVTENVQLLPMMLGGQLRAGNEFDSSSLAGTSRSGTAFDRIMIRQCEGRQAMPPGFRH